MSKSNRARLWAIFGEEEKPRALLFAKTEFGAKIKYEQNTGESRHGIYAERVRFDEGFYAFTETK